MIQKLEKIGNLNLLISFMNYLKQNEKKLINKFLTKGYVIGKVENKVAINIKNLFEG